MNILLVITKGEVGGAQMLVRDLAFALKEKGHNVTVASGGGDYLKDEMEDKEICFLRLKFLKRTHNPLNGVFFIFEIRKLINNMNFDVVHFHSSNALFGAIGAKLSRTKPKTVFTLHGLSLLDKNYAAPRWIKICYLWLFKFLLVYIDHPVFISRLNYAEAVKLGLRVKGEIVPNGINQGGILFLGKQEARGELQKLTGADLSGKYIIGSIGRLAYPKNYEFIINLLSQIIYIKKDCLLFLIGDGPEKPKYRGMIQRHRLENRIILAGEIKNAARLLKAFDLFVLPSHYEGLSITLIEALAAGTPILASRVGGTPELLESTPEQMFEPNNAGDFIEKFRSLFAVQNLSEKNIAQSKKYGIDAVVNNYLQVYSG